MTDDFTNESLGTNEPEEAKASVTGGPVPPIDLDALAGADAPDTAGGQKEDASEGPLELPAYGPEANIPQ